MQPIQFAGYSSSNPFTTAANAQQDFELRKALAAQQLQMGAMDFATKKGLFNAQMQAQAAGTNDQAVYDKAKQTYDEDGTWAPDVTTGAQQAQTSLMAHSSLPGLMNAAANQTKATTGVNSSQGNSTMLVPAPGMPGILIAAPGGSAPAGATPAVTPRAAVTPTQANGAVNADQFNQLFQPQPPDIQAAADAKYGPPQTNVTPNVIPGTTPAVPISSVPPYTPPAYDPSKTPEWNTQNRNQAQESYKLNNAAAIAQQNSKATETGKAQADASKAAVGAGANYDQVVQTINGIKGLVDAPGGLPQDRYGIPAGGKTWLNQNFGDQKLANNANAFTKLNEAQTIGAIKELASTSQIRMTRTLENILNRGYLIDPGASDEGKKQQADIILAELNNSKIAAQNVNAGMNGGQAAPYQQMPAQTGAPQNGVVSYQDYFK